MKITKINFSYKWENKELWKLNISSLYYSKIISSEIHKYIKNHIRIEDFASVVPRRWLQQQTENRENDGSSLMMPRETIE